MKLTLNIMLYLYNLCYIQTILYKNDVEKYNADYSQYFKI